MADYIEIDENFRIVTYFGLIHFAIRQSAPFVKIYPVVSVSDANIYFPDIQGQIYGTEIGDLLVFDDELIMLDISTQRRKLDKFWQNVNKRIKFIAEFMSKTSAVLVVTYTEEFDISVIFNCKIQKIYQLDISNEPPTVDEFLSLIKEHEEPEDLED